MCVLRFEVAPETFATFREAMLGMRRPSGGNSNDDALLLAMARHVLAGPRDDGRASYQISLQVCGVCGVGAQSAAGELVSVDAAVVGMAECDGQHLGELLPSTLQSPTPARRAANENAALDARPKARANRRQHATAKPNGDEMNSPVPIGNGPPSDADDTRESSHQVQAHAGTSEGDAARARCASHESSNHARVGAPLFSALRQLGFRECAVKAVLRELRADAELAAASVERLLREALCRIRPTAH